MSNFFNTFVEKFIFDFIEKDRWKFITGGLKITLIVTFFALVLGILIGMVVAIIRCAHDQQDKNKLKGFGAVILNIANAICRIYVTVIRGTPALVQLLIMYFIVFVAVESKVTVAVLTFAINSGAYVAEIFRGGIMSVDKGQMEAGRSLGLSYVQTMKSVVLPQAFKSCLPALVNEFIALLKETSICGYIGLNELTRGGDIIRGNTYDVYLPLFSVAIIYLVIVMILTWVCSLVERRLRSSDLR
ncbi:MAG: amino acid ABC transporter permease [Lachnospiraceae bacterium]|nr:amino acid ABC transporter permease [Lachnospiraceae bacterium]